MEQYISKSAIVAEIERRIKKYASIDVGDSRELDALYGAKCKALIEILSFLDTLEVKEVGLDKEFDATVCKIGSTYLKEMDKDAIAKALEPYKDGDKVKVIIKAKGE